MDETSFKYFLVDCWLCTFADKHAYCILRSKSEWKHEKRRTEMIMMWHSFFVRRRRMRMVCLYICHNMHMHKVRTYVVHIYMSVFFGVQRENLGQAMYDIIIYFLHFAGCIKTCVNSLDSTFNNFFVANFVIFSWAHCQYINYKVFLKEILFLFYAK